LVQLAIKNYEKWFQLWATNNLHALSSDCQVQQGHILYQPSRLCIMFAQFLMYTACNNITTGVVDFCKPVRNFT